MTTLKAYQREAVDQLLDSIAREPAMAYLTGSTYTPPPARLLQAPTGAGKTIILAQLLIELSRLSHAKMVNGAALAMGELIFVVIAPNSLHEQHYRALDSYGVNQSGGLRLLKRDSLTGSFEFEANDVLVLNWSSVNREGNLLIKSNERDNHLPALFERARISGKNVVLVQDEAHIQTETKNSKKVIEEIIKPAVILNLTATPKPTTGGQTDPSHKVVISHQKVVDDGMIVAKAIANDDDLQTFDQELNELVGNRGLEEPSLNERNIYAAIRKSQLMDEHYAAAGSLVCTITGVQLPVKEKWLLGQLDKDDTEKDSALENASLERTLKFLEQVFGWSVATGEVAIWLAKNKEGLIGNEESIKRFDSPIKVLIFKYALAVGYDLPRMKTGALLHEAKTVSFAVQTLGRFLRQPEQKSYEDEFLNRAYIYTDGKSVTEIADKHNEALSFPPVTKPTVERVRDDAALSSSIENFSLASWYNKQHNPNTLYVSTLKPAFYGAVNGVLADKGKPQLDFDSDFNRLLEPNSLNPKQFLELLGFEWKPRTATGVTKFEISDIDQVNQTGVAAGYAITADQQRVEYDFQQLLREAFNDFDQVQSSRNMGLTLNHFLKEVLGHLPNGIQKLTYPTLQKIIVGTKANEERFLELMRDVLNYKAYENMDRERYTIEPVISGWHAPSETRFSADLHGNAQQVPDQYYLYEGGRPTKLDSKNEERFAKDEVALLAQTFKNKDCKLVGYFKADANVKEWLGVPYPYTSGMRTGTAGQRLFYPDWFFYYQNAESELKLLIVETKQEQVTENSLAKARALKSWLKDQLDPVIGCIANFNEKGRATVLEDGRALHTWLEEQL